MNCEQLEGESPEDTCERLCGYYKFFCPAYAEEQREILNSTDNMEEY